MVKQLEWKKRNIRAVQKAFEEATKNKNVKVLSDKTKFAELRKSEELAQKTLAYNEPSSVKQKIPVVAIKTDAKEAPIRQIPQSVFKKENSYDTIPQTAKHTDWELSDQEFMQGLASRISSENVLRSHTKNVFMTDRDRYQYVITRFYNGEKLTHEETDFMFLYQGKMTMQEESYWDSYIKTNFNRG